MLRTIPTRSAIVALVLALLLTSGLVAAPPDVTVRAEGARLDDGSPAVALVFEAGPGLHLYEDSVAVTPVAPAGLVLGKLRFPPGKSKLDEFTGGLRILHAGSTKVTVPIVAESLPTAATVDVTLTVSHQACTDLACLMPRDDRVSVTIPGRGSLTPASTVPAAAIPQPAGNGSSLPFTDWGLVGYYLAGLLLSMTPCIFPMIPVTVSVIGARKGSSLTGFLRSLVYVLGLAVTYAVLGLAAALGGGVVGAAMQNPWILGAVALLFFAMGLAMLDVFHLTLPSFLGTRLGGGAATGWGGLFLTGMAAGLVASPCVTPVLVGLLLKIAAEGQWLLGFVRLFVFAWGLGTILVVVGTFSSALSALPRAGEWMVEVKKILGLMLMGAGFYYLQGAVATSVFGLLLALFLVATGVGAGGLEPIPAGSQGLYPGLRKAFGLVATATGLYLLVGTLVLHGFILPPLAGTAVAAGASSSAVEASAPWSPASDEALAEAAAAATPVVLDFGAEWCEACRQLERETLRDPRVVDALRRFRPLKVDMTRATPATESLRRRFGVVGFPTLVVLDAAGKVRTDLTQVGFVDAPTLLAVLARVP